MLTSLHLTQTEIQRLFDLSYGKAKKVFTRAMKKDMEDLKGRTVFDDKVRMSTVLWELGISQKEFDRIIAKELKSGSTLGK